MVQTLLLSPVNSFGPFDFLVKNHPPGCCLLTCEDQKVNVIQKKTWKCLNFTVNAQFIDVELKVLNLAGTISILLSTLIKKIKEV